jgi:hypothetical protein
MRSKRPQSRKRRKRQKRVWTPPTDWTPWLWGFLAVHTLIGLYLSPVTGARTIRVTGAPGYDRERIGQFLSGFKDTPFLRVNRSKIQSLAMENLAMERAEYRANPFGRGVLELTYKRPVARVAGTEGLYLSGRGSVFSLSGEVPVRVTVEPPFPVGQRNLSVFSSWRSGVAAQMCENIGERLPESEWRLVEFGSFKDAELKVQALEDILKDDPGLLARVSRLVLSSPSNPVKVP